MFQTGSITKKKRSYCINARLLCLILALALVMNSQGVQHCELGAQLEGQLLDREPLKLLPSYRIPPSAEIWAALADAELPMRSADRLHEGGYASRLGNRRETAATYLADAEASFDGVVLFENDFAGELSTRVAALLRPMPMEHRNIHGKPVLSIARDGSGIGFHRHAESWLRQLSGSKVWLLAPPSARSPPVGKPCDLAHAPPSSVKRCLVVAGEGIYVPPGWWHATCSSGGSIAAGWEGNATSWPEVWHAVADGNLSAVRLDPTAPDAKFASGETTLHLAARAGHGEIIENLLTRRAEPRAATSGGWEPMHLSAGTGHVATTKLLLGKRGELAAVTRDGWTALHVASRHGHSLVVSELLAMRSEVALSTVDSSPLELSMRMGHSTVVEMLLAAGASSDDAATVAGSLAKLDADMLRILEDRGIQPVKLWWQRIGLDKILVVLGMLYMGHSFWSTRRQPHAEAAPSQTRANEGSCKKGAGKESSGKGVSKKNA